MKKLVGILGILLSLWFSLALAQTPAFTSIQNQASATYIDSANQPRSTSSNLVVTLVQQVYSFTITPNSTHSGSPASEANLTAPGQTRGALPGAPVYLAYTVSNTGNGSDTILLSVAQGTADNFDLGSVSLVRDDNCNGLPDAGEPTVTSVSLTQPPSKEASACVIVQGTVPASATNGQTANVNLVGISQAGTPANPADDVTDNNNWGRVIASTAATLTLTKSASPTSSVTPGQNITYTLSGSNTGGNAAGAVTGVVTVGTARNGILITDVIPSGLTYVAGSLSGNAGAGTVTLLYSTNGGTTWAANQPGSGVNAVGMVIEGTGSFFPQGASYTLTFQAQVPASAASGSSYNNSGTLRFDANNNGNSSDAGEVVNSNTTTTTVGAVYRVAIGGTGATAVDGADTQTLASAFSGSTVTFNNTLQNNGNASDSFSLALDTSTMGSCIAYQADGVTPLSGPVGPLAAGATYNVVVKCSIPASQTTGGSVTLTATSVNNPSGNVATLNDGVDATTLAVTTINPGYGVDAAHNTNGASGGEGSNPGNNVRSGYNPAVNPGGSAQFPFEVANTGQNADTYTLTSTLPAGWTAVFYPDSNCDGTLDSPLL